MRGKSYANGARVAPVSTETSNLPVEPKEKPCKCPLLFSNHISISRWTVLPRVIVQIRDTRGHFLLSFSQTERQMPRNCHADIRDCRKPLPLVSRHVRASVSRIQRISFLFRNPVEIRDRSIGPWSANEASLHDGNENCWRKLKKYGEGSLIDKN